MREMRQKGVGDGPENLCPWQLETGHCLAALGRQQRQQFQRKEQGVQI